MTTPGADPRQDLGSWSVVAGDPLSITLTIQVNGVGVNLTTIGSSWSAMARQSSKDSTSQAFTVNATSASTGVLVLSLTAAQTLAMATSSGDKTTWMFDLQASGGTVTPQHPFKGSVVVFRSETHG